MDDDEPIGLPPRKEAPRTDVTPVALWKARGVNLFGLVSPAANLGLVFVAPKARRWFGFGAGVVCAIAILWATSRDRPGVMWIAAGVHYALVLAGLLHPLWVVKVANVWIGFGEILGKVFVYPVFGLIYYGVVTPTALLMRAFGKDPLSRKAPPSETYWVPHEPPGRERYERQF